MWTGGVLLRYSLAREIVRSSRRALRASMCSHGSSSGLHSGIVALVTPDNPNRRRQIALLRITCMHVNV